MVAPLAIPYVLVHWSSELAIIIIFKEMVPGFVGCFILFGLSNAIFSKLRIINFNLSFEDEKSSSSDLLA